MEFFLATGKMTTTLKQHDGHLEVGHFVLRPVQSEDTFNRGIGQ